MASWKAPGSILKAPDSIFEAPRLDLDGFWNDFFEICGQNAKKAKKALDNVICSSCYALKGFYQMPNVAQALQAKANFITIKGPELISKWVGESEKAVREVFKKAKQSSPSIIFLDEFESIASMRNASNGEGSDVGNRVVNQLLASMDGVESLDGVIVVAATNRPEMIDPALLRSGRFERVLHVPPPDAPAREAIFEIHSSGMPLSKFSIKDLLSSMDGFTGADIEAVCREAALIAMRENKKKYFKARQRNTSK